MGRIVVTEFVSVDGVMEDPGGAEGYRHGGWTFKFNDPDRMKFKLDETLDAEALLLGRVTYEGFAKAWPGITDEVGFAAKMNTMPKYVVTSGSGELTWQNSRRLEGDLSAAVQRLKQEVAGTILVAGSAMLVQGLLAHGLVDELTLMVFPVVLGSGKRLFDQTEREPVTLELAENRSYNSGTIVLSYRRPAG